VLPEFEDDDIVFNSSMLKDFVEQMISAGKRNFAIDMSPLDDFSSGDNNALRELNKKVLGVSGTFTLLSPQPKVVGILQRMDIPSIMGVFNTEDELLALSEEIKRQQTPQTEFESLRSEIGNAFGDTPLQQAAAPAPAAKAPPPAPVPMQEAPQSFDAFEIAPPPAPVAPAPQPATPPPPPKAPAFGPPPPRTDSPVVPMPSSQDFPETQRFPEAPARAAAKVVPIEEDFDDFDDFEDKKSKKRKNFDFDDGDDDEFATPKKGFPVIAVIAAVVVIALGVVGVLVFTGKGKDEPAPVAAVTPPPPPPPPAEPEPVKEEIPVATVDAPVVQQPVSVPAPVAKAPAPPPVAKAPPPAPAAKAAPAPAAKAPPPAPAAKAAPPAPTPATKAPPPAPAAAAPTPAPAPAQRNQIVITSNPSGATVEIDGERKGVTPYTWSTPFFGDMVISVSKAGFTKESKSVDYSGGSQTHAFTLRTAAAAPPSPPPPAAAPPPPPPPPPAAAPPPPPPAAAQRPAAPPPAAAGASIFIATLPSHADVFIGGRLIGKSNDAELQVPTGTHQVRFVKDGLEKTESMTFQPGKNPTRFVNLR